MTEITEQKARSIYAKMKAFVHYVWVDEDGFAWERDKERKLPDGWELELRWLPYALEWDDEKEKYNKFAIIDPPTFHQFCEHAGWRIV